jgi:hypothetical protein
VHADGSRSPREVEALLTQAIGTFEGLRDADPRAIACYETYASFLQGTARFDEARTMLDRAGALAQKLFGNALATDLLRRYARLEYARGDLINAEILSRRALANELRLWAERRPEEAAKLRSLAYRVEQPGSPVAEPPYATAFAELRRLEGNGRFELGQWINGIALVLRDVGRRGSIVPMLREALELDCRVMGADCTVRQTTIELFASEMCAQKRGGEAVALLEESLERYKSRGAERTAEALRAGELLERCRGQTTDGGTAPSR